MNIALRTTLLTLGASLCLGFTGCSKKAEDDLAAIRAIKEKEQATLDEDQKRMQAQIAAAVEHTRSLEAAAPASAASK